jgi:hypothetical protein
VHLVDVGYDEDLIEKMDNDVDDDEDDVDDAVKMILLMMDDFLYIHN